VKIGSFRRLRLRRLAQDGPPYGVLAKRMIAQGVFGSELKANALFLVKWLALAYVLEALLVTYVPAR
jgi:hypothetical protein